MGTWNVYKHTTPSNKVYIGITQQKPENRWMKGAGYKAKNSYFYNSIKKYSWDNIKHEILYFGLEETQAKLLEIGLIRYYKSNNKNFGYNQSAGGEGSFGIKRTKEQKEYDSQLAIIRWENENYRKSCIKGQQDYWKEHKGKVHRNPLSNERKQYLSKINKGKPNYKNRGERNFMYGKIPANAKAVLQFDKNGKFVAEYQSIKEAADAVSGYSANIYKVIHNERKYCKGYVWKYKETNK